MDNWKELCRLGGRETHGSAITWPYDKYPTQPQLTAGAEVVLLLVRCLRRELLKVLYLLSLNS